MDVRARPARTGERPPSGVAVLGYYRDMDAGDIGSALARFHPDALYRRPGYQPLDGLESIREFYRTKHVVRRGRHDIEVLVADGDDVAVRGRFEGVSRSGEPLRTRFAEFWRFRGALVIERDTYFDAPVL